MIRPYPLAVTMGLAAACLFFAVPMLADGPDGATDVVQNDADASGDKSLDEQLLDDLNTDLLDDLDALPDADAPDPTDSTDDTDSDLDAQLVEQLIEGDDIGAGEDVDPVTRLARRMQIAQQRIQARKTAATTQRLQQRIIDDLAAIIEEARKAKCKGGDSKPGAGKPGEPKSGQPSSANAQGKKPASNAGPVKSTQRVDKAESSEAKVTRHRALVKQAWGHLPERVREQMPNTAGEEFLPKYEEVIEDYFQRMAEEGRERP
jgi:hypothetical protein